MKKEEFESRVRKINLKKILEKLGYFFLVMVFIGFLLLKLFGESLETYHTFGWYVLVIWTCLCILTFAVIFGGFLFLLFFEIFYSYSNKEKEEEEKKD